MDPEPPVCTVDPYKHLQLVLNPDGSFMKQMQLPDTPVTAADDTTSPVLTKDINVDQTRNTWFRIFLPRDRPDGKLPLVVYFHGGGFLFFSASSFDTHDLCCQIALSIPAVVVSVDYRLAPEHRLPSAYEDSIDSIHKIRDCEDEWLTKYADLSTTFLAGTSAGGNIAYHTGLKLSTAVINGELDPLKIQGLILHHPFFGGVQRTSSELRLINDSFIPLSSTDLMWELALPLGADRDHDFCNPKDGNAYEEEFENIKKMGVEVLVVASDGDPMYDTQRKLADMLAKRGVKISCSMRSGDRHGIELGDPVKAKVLIQDIKFFIGY